MEEITNWFTELKERESDFADLIDKVMGGINEDGFASNTIETWISQELKGIEKTFKTELQEGENDEN